MTILTAKLVLELKRLKLAKANGLNKELIAKQRMAVRFAVNALRLALDVLTA